MTWRFGWLVVLGGCSPKQAETGMLLVLLVCFALFVVSKWLDWRHP